MEDKLNELPIYMREVSDDRTILHYYGELTYDKVKNLWVIKGEPIVCQYAKRIFPGSSGRGGGIAKFQNNKRNAEDLKWLMTRFPLKIEGKNKEIWEQSFKSAVEHIEKKNLVLKSPVKMDSGDWFKGTLKEFQKEGLNFLHNYSPCLLADEMGLGKSIMALAWISKLDVRDMGIFVLPKNIIHQWKETILNFTETKEDEIHIISGLKPYDIPQNTKIVLIHYGILRGWKNTLPDYKFDYLIFDEIQELRHRKTEKYSSASLLAESVPQRIGMSGTPIYNSGGEIWNILNVIEYHCLGDWDEFTREWCYGYGNDVVKKPKDLGDHLKREGLMLRRVKDDVLKELPKKRRVTFQIDSDEKIFTQHIQNALTLVKEYDKTEDQLLKGRIMRLIDTETRKATGLSKAKYVCDFVKLLLESGEKVVLYGWHHDVYDIWKKELKEFNPMMITGKENDIQKARSKQMFIDGKSKVLIISLRASAGIDGLQQVSCINVFGELDWTPGVLAQCEDRLHRIGQHDSVLSYYPLASSGTDEAMMNFLGFKTSQFVGIMGDTPETNEDKKVAENEGKNHIASVIDKLRNRIK